MKSWNNALNKIKPDLTEKEFKSLSLIPVDSIKEFNDKIVITNSDFGNQTRLSEGILLSRLKSIIGKDIIFEIENSSDGFNTGLLIGDFNSDAYSITEKFFNGDLEFSPLLITGPEGCGKTYIINNLKLQHPRINFVTVYSENWKIDFINSLRTGSISHFKDKYRNGDILIIEDLNFLEGSSSSIQEEISILLDTYIKSGKKVVITSRITTSCMDFSAYLKSRLQSGINVNISLPDKYYSVRFLQEKLTRIGIKINIDSLIRDLQINDKNLNFPSLISIINAIYFTLEKSGQSLSTEQIKNIIAARLEITGRRKIDPDRVINVVSEYSNFPRNILLGPSRKKDLVMARHLAIYICFKYSEINKTGIARLFNGRDHTTIIHAVKRVEKLINTDSEIKAKLDSILELLH